MVLGGLWHGAAWTFVLWGVYQGVLLIAYRAAERVAPWFTRFVAGARFRRARRRRGLVMFHLTCYGWLIFRARSAGADSRPDARAWSATSPRRRSTYTDCWCHCCSTRRRSWPCTVRGVVRRRAGRAAPAGGRAILHLRRDVSTSRCCSETSAARSSSISSSDAGVMHLLDLLVIQLALTLLIVAWLPGAVIFRLPVADRDGALRSTPRSGCSGRSCSASRSRSRSCSALAAAASLQLRAAAHRRPDHRVALAAAARGRLRLGSRRARPGLAALRAALRSCCWRSGGSFRRRSTSSAARIPAST